MIRVTVIDEDLVEIRISGSKEEFYADLAQVKRVSFGDRSFNESDPEDKFWEIENPQVYQKLIPEIEVALEDYRRQLRMFDE